MTGAKGGFPIPEGAYVRDLPPYPFAALDEAREAMEAAGTPVVDLGLGDPRQQTPDFIKQALFKNIPERSTYPRAAGLSRLREAAGQWLARRFDVTVDPGTEVLPANGSKEALFHFPLAVISDSRPLALVPDPGYPVYDRGVRAAGGTVFAMPLEEKNGFLPDLASIPSSIWGKTAFLVINYPNNPTAATASPEFLEKTVALSRKHGVVLVSDEAYSEVYFGDSPDTALSWGTENVLALHTLSKRSGVPGFRSGFMAGDSRIMANLKKIRPAMGLATPQFVQETAAGLWDDEEHVNEIRGRFRENRDLMVSGLRGIGFNVPEVRATFFIWLPVPKGQTSESFALACLEAGVAVLPGTALGGHGEGFVRLSFSGEKKDLQEAVARLGTVSL